MPKAVIMEERPGKPGAVYFPFVPSSSRSPETNKAHSLKIVEVPRPSADDDQVVVKMLCAALNRRDMFARQRLYPGAAGNVPILADGAGIVTECGSGVNKSWVGKRVILTPARGYVFR